MYAKYIKSILDFITAFFILLIMSPIIILFTIGMFIQNKGKPFYLQQRPGKNEKPFNIIKFKTMTDEKDSDGNLLPDNTRITLLGQILRKFSIDELPQFINVLKGEMSIVGPRPLLFKYIPIYTPNQRRRHDVKPGITGLAQISGRNSITWNEKLCLDIKYVDNISLSLDLKIFLLTIKKVIKREGINQSESRPMQPFNGKN